MNTNRFLKRVAAPTSLVLLLFAVPGLARTQSPAPAPVPVQPQTPRKIVPLPRPTKAPSPMDDFAGLTYTNEQKAKIREIHQDIKKRMDAVVRDNKLSPEQKGAMLQGYQHMERGQVYKVLTADQQVQVRKKAVARRRAALEEREKEKEKERQLQSPQAPQP